MVVEAELSFLSNKSSHRLRPDTFRWQIWLKHESLPCLTIDGEALFSKQNMCSIPTWKMCHIFFWPDFKATKIPVCYSVLMISWNTHIQDDTHRDRMISQLWCQGRATKVLENRKNRKRILEAAEIPTQQSNWLLGDWVWLRSDRFDFMNLEKIVTMMRSFQAKNLYRCVTMVL